MRAPPQAAVQHAVSLNSYVSDLQTHWRRLSVRSVVAWVFRRLLSERGIQRMLHYGYKLLLSHEPEPSNDGDCDGA